MASSSHTSDSHSGHGDHAHHVIPMRKLITTFALLLVLMVLTIGAAVAPYYVPGLEFLENPQWRLLTNGIALSIAFIKAGLVVQTFMGVKHSTNVVKFYAYGGFLWFILIFIILLDYFFRPFEPVQGWEKEASTGLPRDMARPDGTDPAFTLPRPEKKEEHGGGH